VPVKTFSRAYPAAGAVCAGIALLLLALCPSAAINVFPTVAAQSDLDAFMQQVVARRDDNWKKLQQYILDERQLLDLRGPGNVRMWGEDREYTWFIRDGFFVRSPVRFNGVTISEDERRKEEDEYLRRARRRDERALRDAQATGTTPPADTSSPASADAGRGSDGAADTPTNVDGLIRQTRQPQFISSAYFLRFKFDAGTYALVGREMFEGREVLRVEYYPTRLYERPEARGGRGRRSAPDPNSKEGREETELRRVMNKVALITLWIEPASHQIVKYTFDNVDFDFLPGQWLVKVDTARASMTMGQAFKDVWLPRGIEVNVGLTLATGEFAFRATVDYHDYREANVTSKVGIPGASKPPDKR
jgi:hypothetical protein